MLLFVISAVRYIRHTQQMLLSILNRSPIWRVWTLSSKTTNIGWSCFWMSWEWVEHSLLWTRLWSFFTGLTEVSRQIPMWPLAYIFLGRVQRVQNFHCVCRMSPTSLKPQSTLGQTCRGTWLRCMRSVPPTQTSSGRWATRGEHSRWEANDVTAVNMHARFMPFSFQGYY